MATVKFYPFHEIEDTLLQFVVTTARYEGKWVFSKHKERATWDMPGGHREAGESVLQAMRRELWEETGAESAEISPVSVYSVTKDGVTTYGALFHSEIDGLGELPKAFEMEKIQLTDAFPENLTYPDIQPELFSFVQGWLNLQSNPDELWDVYDENRNRTGKLHRRGEPLKAGEFHLVVHVWILGTDGRFLLTKRSSTKGFPNMWETTGGSALAGDDSITAALREVKEETGLDLDPDRGTLVMSEMKKDWIRDVWLFRQDLDLADVVLQPGETTDKMYGSIDAIRDLVGKKLFVPYDYLEELFSLIGIDK